MLATKEELLEASLALPERERMELAEALLASVPPLSNAPIDEAWRAVIAQRAAELESGQVQGVPWSEVKRQGREQASA